MDYFYRNGDGDEMLFVHYGTGKIETMFGTIHYRKGDYVTIQLEQFIVLFQMKERLSFLL